MVTEKMYDKLAQLVVRKGANVQKDQPLIIPRAAAGLLSSDPALADMKIVTVYNLIYNASLFVEDGT